MRLTITLFAEFHIALLIFVLPCALFAADNTANSNPISVNEPALNSLPNPLSLDLALKLASQENPDVQIAKARVDDAQAQLLQAQSKSDFTSFIDLSAQRLKLSTTGEIVNDNFARLVVSKTLYDFGRTSSMEESKTSYLNSREFLFEQTKLQHQLEVMTLFFNVLLADSRYTVDNEEMVQRYLKYDKKKERYTLGMVSPIELNEAENYYREAFDIRDASEKNQRSTRLLLAISLNHPDQLPTDLVPPELSGYPEQIPDTSAIFNRAIRSNPTILSLQQEVDAARKRVSAERARYRPILSAEVQIADYERNLSSRGDYLAALTLTLPIYQGSQPQAEIARATADLSIALAQLKKAEQILLQNVSSLVTQLEVLKTKQKTAEQRIKFRDLNLEYNRALYELEIQSNFSDSQARITEAQWLAEKVKYDTALTWAQINVLLGRPLLQQHEVTSP